MAGPSSPGVAAIRACAHTGAVSHASWLATAFSSSCCVAGCTTAHRTCAADDRCTYDSSSPSVATGFFPFHLLHHRLSPRLRDLRPKRRAACRLAPRAHPSYKEEGDRRAQACRFSGRTWCNHFLPSSLGGSGMVTSLRLQQSAGTSALSQCAVRCRCALGLLAKDVCIRTLVIMPGATTTLRSNLGCSNSVVRPCMWASAS